MGSSLVLNKFDLLKGNKASKEKKISDIQKKIEDFFKERKITINDFFITCGETVKGFDDVETYNNKVAEMILEIVS